MCEVGNDVSYEKVLKAALGKERIIVNNPISVYVAQASI